VSGEGILGRLNRWQAAGAVRRTLRRLGLSSPVLLASVPTAIDYVGQLGESKVVYYITDDFSLWPGGNARKIRQADMELAHAADLLLPCNQILADLHADCGGKMHLLAHAVDLEHFSRDDLSGPEDLPEHSGPRVCFFGLIYEKIDLGLIARFARQRPDVQVVMIGPVKTDISAAEALGNVVFLGPRDHQDLPSYLQTMDALIVPYVRDEETLRKGPLKIRECLAAGKPTVALRIPDLLRYDDLIVLYEQDDEFADAVDRALAMVGQTDLAGAMRDRISHDTWASRVEVLFNELDQLDRNERR
ncbi:MAG: glycosyltransferase, partial [Planctomycetota bacterium]